MGSFLGIDRLPSIFEEDTAHTDGDRGQFILAVRNDVEGTLVDADGDYAPLQVDDEGRLRIIGDLDVTSAVADDAPDTENPLKVGSRSRFGAVLPAISDTNDKADLISDEFRRLWINDAAVVGITSGNVSVDNTGSLPLPAVALNGRRRIVVQNRSDDSIFVGPSGVSSAIGVEVSRDSNITLEVSEEVIVHAIGTVVAAQDVRVLEFG